MRTGGDRQLLLLLGSRQTGVFFATGLQLPAADSGGERVLELQLPAVEGTAAGASELQVLVGGVEEALDLVAGVSCTDVTPDFNFDADVSADATASFCALSASLFALASAAAAGVAAAGFFSVTSALSDVASAVVVVVVALLQQFP